MEISSLVISIIGIIISFFAAIKAHNAKSAVDSALGERNLQEDLFRLKLLVVVMTDAKDAVMPWVGGAPVEKRQGRKQKDDLGKLHDSIDQLRTKSPVGASHKINTIIRRSADNLDEALRQIVENTSSGKDYWKEALVEIQQIIPRLEQEERSIRDNQIMKGSTASDPNQLL